MPVRLVSITALLLLTGFGLAQQQQKIRIEGPFAARDGDICVVCNSKLSRDDFAYKINGQRVTVMRGMEGDLLAAPHKFIQLQHPGGGGDGGEQVPMMSPLATWAGSLLLIGLMCGGACAYLAPSKGFPAMPWFWWGLLFSVPAVVMLAMKENSASVVDPADPA